MTPWLKISLILFEAMCFFTAGFIVAKRFDLAKQEQVVAAALQAQKDAEERTANIADSYEKYRAGNESYIANLLEQVRKAHEKAPIPANCFVPDDRMQQIRNAVTGSR